MNVYKNIIEAFKIFDKYATESDAPVLQGTNGEVYAGVSPDVVEQNDLKRLNELGWQDKGVDGCFVFKS